MRTPQEPRKSERYFDFFENKAKNVSRFLAWVLVAGLSVNIVFVALIGFGVIPRSQPKVRPNTTPIPEPAHFLDAPSNSAGHESPRQGLSANQR